MSTFPNSQSQRLQLLRVQFLKPISSYPSHFLSPLSHYSFQLTNNNGKSKNENEIKINETKPKLLTKTRTSRKMARPCHSTSNLLSLPSHILSLEPPFSKLSTSSEHLQSPSFLQLDPTQWVHPQPPIFIHNARNSGSNPKLQLG